MKEESIDGLLADCVPEYRERLGHIYYNASESSRELFVKAVNVINICWNKTSGYYPNWVAQIERMVRICSPLNIGNCGEVVLSADYFQIYDIVGYESVVIDISDNVSLYKTYGDVASCPLHEFYAICKDADWAGMISGRIREMRGGGKGFGRG